MSRVMRLIGVALFTIVFSLVSILAAKSAVKLECVAGCGGPLDGTAKGARLIEPFGVAFDKQGNWYICEYKGQRITKVDTRGSITLFAGRDGQNPEGSARGQLEFNDPHGLVISKDQQMYVADTLNHRAVKLDLKTGRAVVVAGGGRAGFSGDGGQAVEATFNQFYAVDINRAGDKLFITDLGNRRVRLLDLKSGVVTTIAGNGQSGVPDDEADAAQSPLVDPRATAVDSKGNVYILERRGNALRVVDKNGKIRTVIAPGTIASAGARAAGLNGPKHLCVDLQDNVIIADTENHLIRKYNPKGGAVEVIAGSGEKGDRLITGDPLKTQLNRPHGVFVHPSGALYISDSYNHRVLKLSDLSTPRSPAEAAPSYDLEGLLKRAEIVYVGRVSELSLEKQQAMLSTGKGGSHISDRKIQLEIVEVLRGSKGDLNGNYGLLGLGDRAEIQIGGLFLVLSQGDNYWGRPEPVISFLQLAKGQGSYCGWLMYPLSNAGGDGVIASLHSSKLENNGPLTLNRVKEAVGETRYNPDLHGKRRQ